jgi:hypothetical protein
MDWRRWRTGVVEGGRALLESYETLQHLFHLVDVATRLVDLSFHGIDSADGFI